MKTPKPGPMKNEKKKYSTFSGVGKLVLLFALLLIVVRPSQSEQIPVKVLYENNQLPAGWKAEPTQGASLAAVQPKNGIQFDIAVWKDGVDMWPRLLLSGPGVDVSDYSKMIVEIENPTAVDQNIVIAAKATQEDNAGQAWLIPAHSTRELTLDISDGAPLDQSSVKEILLYLYQPLTLNTYVLKKVSFAKSPDFTSKKVALGQQLDETLRSFDVLQKATAKNTTIAPDLRSIQAVLETARTAYTQASPGYAIAVQKLLLEAQQSIARQGINMRGADLWVWSSPLGMAIREGTLPSPKDAALTAIKDQVCLNQYKAICVNVSAAAQAQIVQLQLNTTAGQDKLFSLRPTLFSKVRDGSLTADAIGEKTNRLNLTVDPYQTQQILVWVNTKGAGIKPGRYTASLTLTSGKDKAVVKTIPLNIEVAAVRLPSAVPVSIHNWAYFYIHSTPVTKGLEKEALANMRDYGVNTWSQDYTQVPLPRLNAANEYDGLDPKTLEPYVKLMELLKGHPDEIHILWLGFQRAEVRELLARPGVLKGYLKDMHALLDKYKIPLDKRYIQFWDEPRLGEIRESMEWMRKVRALDPTFKFYENGSVIPPGAQEWKEFIRLVDCWGPNWDQLYVAKPEDGKTIAAAGFRHLGFYRCLMSRNNRGVNIYEYYRLMSWRLMEQGFDNLAFWAYNVGSEDAWDGTTGTSSGGIVVYQKDGKLLTSRRWELFREGLDDYKLAQAAFDTKGILDARKQAQLMEICNDVAAHPNEPRYADQMRLKLIGLAVKKQKVTKQ